MIRARDGAMCKAGGGREQERERETGSSRFSITDVGASWLIAWFEEDWLGIRGGFFFDRQQTDSKGVATEYPSILLLTAC